MNYETLLLGRENGVATITLNRPKVYNAISVTMLQELMRALDSIEHDETIRSVLLTGSGRAFSSGGDLGGPLDPEVDGPAAIPLLPQPERDAVLARIGNRIRDSLIANHNRVALRLHQFPKPLICAINGIAAGGGVGLALSCDIVVAARSAKLLQVFTPQLAFVPDFGCSWHLTRLLGTGRANALALLGEPLPAEDAARHGLIWKVFDDAELATGALDIAKRVAANAALANQLTKRALQQAQFNTLEQQLALEAELQGRCAGTLAFIEGILAFQEKRKPQFHPVAS